MKKLLYNIYRNTPDEQFLQIEAELLLIEANMLNRLSIEGWVMSTSVSTNDALVISFVKRPPGVYGNLGINYLDKPSAAIFDFYVTKAVHQNSYRYFLKEELAHEISLEELKNSYMEYTTQAIALYEEWTNDVVIEKGERDFLN